MSYSPQTAAEVLQFIIDTPPATSEVEWEQRWTRPVGDYGFLDITEEEVIASEITNFDVAEDNEEVKGPDPVAIFPSMPLYSRQSAGLRMDALAHYLNATNLFDWEPWYGVKYPVVFPWKDGFWVLDGHHRLVADRMMGRVSRVYIATARTKNTDCNRPPLNLQKGFSMKQNLKNKAVAVQTHVAHYRGRYAAVATLAVCAAINTIRVNQVNEFLEERGLLAEFYNPEAALEIES